MKNIYHNTWWDLGTNPVYVEPLTITIIKEMCNGTSYKYFVQLKLCRDPTSSTLDLYKFKMYLFGHGNPEEFLFLIRNFNMNIAEQVRWRWTQGFSIFVS